MSEETLKAEDYERVYRKELRSAYGAPFLFCNQIIRYPAIFDNQGWRAQSTQLFAHTCEENRMHAFPESISKCKLPQLKMDLSALILRFFYYCLLNIWPKSHLG